MTNGASDEGEIITQALHGDATAIERLLMNLQPRIYRLAVRMLWHPEDARDATQEILIRIVSNLSSFRGESAFSTWSYRIAANYLMTARKSRLEQQNYSFERFGQELGENLSAPKSPEDVLLLEEVKLGCTLGMLQCLDRPLRIAYIVGEILELDHAEAAAVLQLSTAAYRKRLSRARELIVAFMQARCGLVEPRNRCRCSKRVEFAIQSGRVNAAAPLFAHSRTNGMSFRSVLNEIRKLEQRRRAAALFRSEQEAVPPAVFTGKIRELLAGLR
jgi:RNA polymerase sigma factor (sigma-70 family)